MAVKHEIAKKDGGTEIVELNYAKAIRRKCLDCSNFSPVEVKICSVNLCPLWPFRFGNDPGRIKRVLTDEQKAEMAERLAKARESK